MGNLGVPELLLILAIVIIVFGAGKLPQLGKGVGEGIRNFKDAMKDGRNGDAGAQKEDPASKPK